MLQNSILKGSFHASGQELPMCVCVCNFSLVEKNRENEIKVSQEGL
jgi:hypothetical protein